MYSHPVATEGLDFPGKWGVESWWLCDLYEGFDRVLHTSGILSFVAPDRAVSKCSQILSHDKFQLTPFSSPMLRFPRQER